MTTDEQGRVIVAGVAAGEVVALDEPLSFWGGFDAASGQVIDVHHPQHGADLSGRVVVMASGRGSSSASSVILEAGRVGTAPAALVVQASDEIIATGAIVADELYGRPLPIVEVDAAVYGRCCNAAAITIGEDGQLQLR